MDENKTIIYVKGILNIKKCSNVIFYGEIKKIKNSEFIVNCIIYSTVNNLISFYKNKNDYICCCMSFGNKTKKEIKKLLKLDYWGQSKNITGIK